MATKSKRSASTSKTVRASAKAKSKVPTAPKETELLPLSEGPLNKGKPITITLPPAARQRIKELTDGKIDYREMLLRPDISIDDFLDTLAKHSTRRGGCGGSGGGGGGGGGDKTQPVSGGKGWI